MATRGRPAFQPTTEQRQNVEIMVGLGIPEEKICLVVRDQRDKPICRNTLRKHFQKELETGATKLNAKVGHFMVAPIFGVRPPEGTTPITDERVRGRLGELYSIDIRQIPGGLLARIVPLTGLGNREFEPGVDKRQSM